MEQKDIEVKKDREEDRYLAHFIVFQEDKKTFVLYRKTEKIVAALYLVTNFFPSSDPLMNSLRTGGITLLSLIATLPLVHDTVGRGDLCRKIKGKTLELVSWCDLGETAGYLSPMNASVIRMELLKTARHAEELTGERDGALQLGSELFAVDAGTMAFSKTEISSSPLFRDKGQKDIKDSCERPIKRSISTGIAKKTARSPEKKNLERPQAILALFKQKDRLNVKDVAAVIHGCSEKTLQRQLLALVASGVLKKEGERRWSSYVLA